MAATKILLVLGAGKNIGQSLAHGFKAAGYKIALVSRSAEDQKTTPDGFLTLRADLSAPSTIPSIFDKVRAALGGPPSVVVYNASGITKPTDPTNPLSVPLAGFESALHLTNTSAYVAAGQAVAGFESLPKELPKVFIFTGNICAVQVIPGPPLVTLGVGKSAASYWVGSAAAAFKEKGYRFYYADERRASGEAVYGDISGAAAAEFYVKLAEEESNVPWYATFVAGKGFVDFPETRRV